MLQSQQQPAANLCHFTHHAALQLMLPGKGGAKCASSQAQDFVSAFVWLVNI